MIPRGGERILGTLKIDGSKKKSVKMSNRVFWSREFSTWIVEVNLARFAFVSKKAADQFLDDMENKRERMFFDELDEESDEICGRDLKLCICSANYKPTDGER